MFNICYARWEPLNVLARQSEGDVKLDITVCYWGEGRGWQFGVLDISHV